MNRNLLPLAAAALLFAAPAAHALFKVVGPDGKVTYTDRVPSPADGRAQAVNRDTGRVAEVQSQTQAQLPFALRQVAARFPVVLFTADDCGDPCVQGRTHLARRGIPYAERMASNADDRDAWATVVGGIEAPVLRVGSQSLRSYNPNTWDESLDVAGYPRQSLLPPSYQPPPVATLTERKAAPAPKPPPPPPAETNSAPGGIRF